jgi:polyisoprenyl-phosphate glycosyltransferase
MKKLISVVIPAYNEEEVLEELKKRLQEVIAINSDYNFEIIIIENGSIDHTYDGLVKINKEDRRFKIIRLSRNFGCDGGIAAGLSYAKGDAAVIMNADLQDPPELIGQFIEKWEEGYEIVYGIIKKREGVAFTRAFMSSMFYKIINRLTNDVIPENVSDFRLVDRKVYSVVKGMDERNKFLRGMIAWTGFKQTGIPFERPARFAGTSKGAFLPTFQVALNGIFSFSYLPLKIATMLGFLVSLGSFSLAFIEFVLWLKYGSTVQGFTTMILVILFLFGTLFLLIGIMGEYVARIYDEVKGRPNWIVTSDIGFDP